MSSTLSGEWSIVSAACGSDCTSSSAASGCGEGPAQHPLVIEEVRVVERGPVQATLHLLGHYGTEKAYKPAMRADKDVWRYPVSLFVRAYGGSSRVHVQHTFGYNGDEYSDFVQSYGLTVPTGLASGTFLYGTGRQRPAATGLGVRLNQFAHDLPLIDR